MLARGADALADAARSIGERAVTIVCDVTDSLALDAALARLNEEFGDAPAVLVNNAGFFSLAAFEATTVDDFRSAIDVNLVAPFRLVHAFLPAMRARRSGHIVTIGSIADRVAFPENGAYAASKFGVRALHEVLRAELKGSGVRATLVSPAAVDTPLWDPVNPDERPGFTARREMLRAEAVAAAVHVRRDAARERERGRTAAVRGVIRVSSADRPAALPERARGHVARGIDRSR